VLKHLCYDFLYSDMQEILQLYQETLLCLPLLLALATIMKRIKTSTEQHIMPRAPSS